MIKRLVSGVGLTASLLLVSAGTSAAQRGGGSLCLGPDTISTGLINWARQIIKTTDVHADSLRNSIGLNGVDTLSVALVTTSKTCASASAAIDQALHLSPSGHTVYVLQAGRQRFLVQDPTDKSTEYARAWVFDSHFNFVAALSK